MRKSETFWNWLRRLAPAKRQEPPRPIRFAGIETLDRAPKNREILGDKFYVVVTRSRQHWALFMCPCGCGEVITLSLQKVHDPHWVVRKSRDSRPTLRPSVWRDRGCYSHFWVSDGRIYWVGNTGRQPAL